jgi:hypothetical protein
MSVTQLYIGFGVLVAFFGLLAALNQRRARQWRRAVRNAAERYKLKYTQVGNAARANGDHHGHRITICLDREHKAYSDSDTKYSEIDVRSRFDAALVIVRRGKLQQRPHEPSSGKTIDYGAKPKTETPTGDASFDQRVEIYGANKALLEALRQGPLRDAILGILDEGLRIENGHVLWHARLFPNNEGELSERLEKLLQIGDELVKVQPL